VMPAPLTFGSLFAGIGGMDLGLERAGMVCRWQVEIDDYATRVLEKHWPGIVRHRDVRDVGRHNLAPVDLIAGGFPCQDISNAGKRAGITGDRSGLWSEFTRVVGELRPRYVLMENVSALLRRGIDTILGELAALGFDAEWHCIPAGAVGAPHRRDRIFIVAHRQDDALCSHTNGAGSHRTAMHIDRKAQFRHEQIGFPGPVGEKMADPDRQRLEVGPCFGRNARKELAAFERDCRTGAGQWAIEPDVDRVANGVPSRVDRLRCLGNAVVPQVAEFVGRCIVEAPANA
jgi:DNA (cytosine-5)-methyltransferase 1